MKIVSGGQAGVDRAALNVGLAFGLEVGGWCPKGRWAEDGPIPAEYPLLETRTQDLAVRTQRNVECSTATLVLTRGSPMGGTRLTVEYASCLRRPLLVVDLSDPEVDAAGAVSHWLQSVRPRVLNVAGPRESGAPGITEEASHVLAEALRRAPRFLSERH